MSAIGGSGSGSNDPDSPAAATGLRRSPRKSKTPQKLTKPSTSSVAVEPEKEKTLLHVLMQDLRKLADLAKIPFHSIIKKMNNKPTEDLIRKENIRLQNVIKEMQQKESSARDGESSSTSLISKKRKLKTAVSITAALDAASQELAGGREEDLQPESSPEGSLPDPESGFGTIEITPLAEDQG